MASDAKVLYDSDSSVDYVSGNFMMVGGGRGGFVSDYVGYERTAEPVSLYCRPEFHAYYAYKPGTITLQPSYRGEAVGGPYVIIIEEPVITTNAPETVTAGSTLNLDTALTNTSLENLKTADYDNPDNYDSIGWYLDSISSDNNRHIAYKPSVTIIEGEDLVTQSNQDYSNTLTSSETLTFHKAGTVRLKISYNQYITIGKDQIEYEDGTPTGNMRVYNPEKIITIQVTDDSVPSQPVITTDETTGIKLEAEAGVVPPDTVLKAEQVKEGGNFVIINNALQTTSDKWVAYDISLLSNNAEIQPSGKVTVSIPRPRGLNMNKMVLYHVAEDGTLTQIPFALDGTKDNILFETDHFSLYAVVEAGNTTEQPSSSSSAAPGNDATVSTGVSSVPNNSATASEAVSSTPGNSAATSETASTAPSNDNVPKTGGDSHVLIFVVLILASACALLLVFITNKKHIRQAK